MAKVKKSFISLESMNHQERRSFLKKVGLLMASPVIDQGLRYFLNESVGGVAHAQSMGQPVNLIEISIRDQIDLGQAFVAPGVATNRSDSGTFKNAFQPNSNVSNLYLTSDSNTQFAKSDGSGNFRLGDFAGTLAVIDTNQGTAGAIHNHEAGNPIRLPGRRVRNVEQNVGGMQPAWRNDCSDADARGGGNNEVYSRTPSYDCLHNFHVKSLNLPGVRNGVNLKGIGGGHRIYHYPHTLQGAAMTRYTSSNDVITAFSGLQSDQVVLNQRERDSLFDLMKFFDARLVRGAEEQHDVVLRDANREVINLGSEPLNMNLTAEERAYWINGLPTFGTNRQPGYTQRVGTSLPLHFQVAYAHKLIRSGLVRTVSLEFDFQDYHDARTGRSDAIMGHWARYFSGCLSKLINKLNEDNLYNQTVVTMVTADGSLPTRASQLDGKVGKNTFVMAGGMVRGGYYGDIRREGNEWRGYMPNLDTGAAGQRYDFGRDRGLNGAHVWRTVAKALQVPDSLATNFADTQNFRPLNFMLRS